MYWCKCPMWSEINSVSIPVKRQILERNRNCGQVEFCVPVSFFVYSMIWSKLKKIKCNVKLSNTTQASQRKWWSVVKCWVLFFVGPDFPLCFLIADGERRGPWSVTYRIYSPCTLQISGYPVSSSIEVATDLLQLPH